MIYLDTETCGLHGPTILIQWAEDEGPIHLHNVWKSDIRETIELIEYFCDRPICGFNLVFDWFHICQTYTTLIQFKDWDDWPDQDDYAIYEERARFGPCVKPVSALDLMLHARKGPYQSTMDRKDIKIRKVPTALAWRLADHLNKNIPLKDVYFARKKSKKRWGVYDRYDEDGDLDPNFKDILLKFAPSSALKALTADALGIDVDSIKLFSEVDPPKSSRPNELGWAPYALAVGKPGAWNGAWPEYGKLNVQISHWSYNQNARQYATDDVVYTRMLYKYFSALDSGNSHHDAQLYAKGEKTLSNVTPLPHGDTDSILACMVAAVRWRGFALDIEGIKELKQEAIERTNIGFNFNSPKVCKIYLTQVMTPMERLALKGSTKKVVLESVAKWKIADVCNDCGGMGCDKCKDGLVDTDQPHPAAERAQAILDARHAKKEIELFDKLLQAGRLHASLKVIGTLSSRMAGADGLNPQAIRRTKIVRSKFTMADDGLILCGGDFDGYEVTLMDAAYGDPELRKALQTKHVCYNCDGKGCGKCDNTGEVLTKIHGMFGTFLFPGKSYKDILLSSGLPGDQDLYERSKRSVFAVAYGGEGFTISNRVGVKQELADKAYNDWCKKYKVWGAERKKIFDKFCSMKQPGGIGTKVEWSEPADYIESMFGFKRYFTLENMICKTLFNLAENPPKDWNDLKIKVVRRDREQTACGAVRSALFAAAFALQAANMRAAANHVIQSTGSTITKMLQHRIWDFQPAGIANWRVQPFNSHDEITAPTHPEIAPAVEASVNAFIEEMRAKVPLISMTWKTNLKSWADK